MKAQAKVAVVSASDVVRLADVTDAVALAFTSVHDAQLESVSILTERFADGDVNFFNDSFNVVIDTPVPK